ncbi:hypothetical protein HMPREF9380_1924 [Streptococcus sanguinis SK49]|uniref:Fungal lipase-like domain-containing protein n=2 Tax=Streptococcus TaxID=1301 RepID=F3UZI4_STRSA|nr:hypothetical protein [Streptococcus sanguinis]EGJ37076.1 hypothetical protein HMPREF9380_1924 [Streptococcus sanguinis SK49]
MSNWNLKSFDNLYASLAESAYRDRPNKFPYEQLDPKIQKTLDSGKSVEFNFSTDGKDSEGKVTHGGGTDLPNGGKVYLQPDNKKLLEDEETGYHAYYVTDTDTINQNTKQTYFAVRGSDGFGIDIDEAQKDWGGYLQTYNPSDFNFQDWVYNDAAFALTDAIVPQAKHATEGMKAKIAELNQYAAPDAKMDITAHSLGTMTSIQGVAGLNEKELNKVGQIVLFDGPDPTKSLEKAGYGDKIPQLDAKTIYYVNPFDPVSMLNRDKPWDQQLGDVRVVVPIEYTSMMDKHSSHDFGAYQIDSKGNLLEVSEDYHPELWKAGHKLAELNKKSIENIKKYVPEKAIEKLVTMSPGEFSRLAGQLQDSIKSGDLSEILKSVLVIKEKLGLSLEEAWNIANNIDKLKATYKNYEKEYEKIIKDAKKESLAWDRKNLDLNNPNNLHERIKRAGSYEDRILLRSQLLYTAVELAGSDIEQKISEVKTALADAESNLKGFIEYSRSAIKILGFLLSDSEIEGLMSELSFENLWDSGINESNISHLKEFETKITNFSQSMIQCAQNLEQVDAQGAADIFAAFS